MNTENNKSENNRLIAKFMESKVTIDTYFINGMYMTINESDLKYHSDWNWLMQVVEKIESLNVVVEIRENVCYIETTPNDYYSELEETKIQATYNAVVRFIKWYNENKI